MESIIFAVSLAHPSPSIAPEIRSMITSMPKTQGKATYLPLDDSALRVGQRKSLPHQFVLDALTALSPWTRPMFGCLAVYVEDKIVLILRDKREQTADNGVWLATTEEHHESLRREFPSMRSIRVLGKAVTGWQVLPADAADFEEAALRACELVLARDPRIGKVPGARRSKRSTGEKTATSTKAARAAQSGAGNRAKSMKRFPHEILAVIRESRSLRLRAGNGTHRFIGIWVVVVKDRVFIRSWSVKANGWYRTFLKEPRGAIQVSDYGIAVRAVPAKSERLRNAVDRAYLDKYGTPGALKYAKDLAQPKSRATTIELVPL
jgi:hypothetical protein